MRASEVIQSYLGSQCKAFSHACPCWGRGVEGGAGVVAGMRGNCQEFSIGQTMTEPAGKFP